MTSPRETNSHVQEQLMKMANNPLRKFETNDKDLLDSFGPMNFLKQNEQSEEDEESPKVINGSLIHKNELVQAKNPYINENQDPAGQKKSLDSLLMEKNKAESAQQEDQHLSSVDFSSRDRDTRSESSQSTLKIEFQNSQDRISLEKVPQFKRKTLAS